jgi:hypothetical protein
MPKGIVRLAYFFLTAITAKMTDRFSAAGRAHKCCLHRGTTILQG